MYHNKVEGYVQYWEEIIAQLKQRMQPTPRMLQYGF